MNTNEIFQMIEERQRKLQKQLEIVSSGFIEDESTVSELTFGIRLCEDFLQQINTKLDK